MEYLVAMTTRVFDNASGISADGMRRREAARSGAVQPFLGSSAVIDWPAVESTPLTRHPGDPASADAPVGAVMTASL